MGCKEGKENLPEANIERTKHLMKTPNIVQVELDTNEVPHILGALDLRIADTQERIFAAGRAGLTNHVTYATEDLKTLRELHSKLKTALANTTTFKEDLDFCLQRARSLTPRTGAERLAQSVRAGFEASAEDDNEHAQVVLQAMDQMSNDELLAVFTAAIEADVESAIEILDDENEKK